MRASFRRAARGFALLGLLAILATAVTGCDDGAGPSIYGIPRSQALVLHGGESNNPREYDPATGDPDDRVFSGLVNFNPDLQVAPDLARSWEVSQDGTVYTFHLRPNARFHSGRAVTTDDVIYSWERAADPATDSNTVLTYLGDIVGVREMREGKANHISGVKALDKQTLQVTLDAPKPYFLMKLAYGVADVVDRANVESGPGWYRTPNGTGPYKLTRWDSSALQIYERNADFYLTPPAIKYIIVLLYQGTGIQLYEAGDIDMTGVSNFNVGRVLSPDEPLHKDLVQGVSLCTVYVTFDVTRAPFDDPKVRQAFALAVDRQAYVDKGTYDAAIPAKGLYPPALPGYNPQRKAADFNPALARQLLRESMYEGVSKLPRITFTTGGFGNTITPREAVLAEMWKQNLGVDIEIENLEPDRSVDEVQAGHHGQMVFYSWCADYPDPENFADVLFHSGTENNVGHYSNAALDRLLEKARIERDVKKRLEMYGQAEEMLIGDGAAIFLSHRLSYMLVKPYVKGPALVPISVPVARYLRLDASKR